MTEKRRHERVRVSLFIDWGFTIACVQQARLTSFSVGGCFVQTADEAAMGQEIFLRLGLPGERALRAEVRYHMPEVGFGVMFSELTIEDQLTLESLVAHYHKQVADETRREV